MALNNNKKDIFGLGSLVPPSNNENDKIPAPEISVIEVKKDIKEKDDKKEIEEIENIKEKPKKKVSKKDIALSSVKVKFFDEDDKNFLRYYGGNMGFTQEEFIIYLIENDIKDKSGIDRRDELHQAFSTKTLYYYTSVRIPEKLKKDMLKRQAMHSLTQEQYLGLIVRAFRLKTPGWH